MMKSKHHLGVHAIDAADKGDIIVIDNGGDLKNNCWGEILSMGAKMKGVAGVVVDGAARDTDMCKEFEFPVDIIIKRTGSYSVSTEMQELLMDGIQEVGRIAQVADENMKKDVANYEKNFFLRKYKCEVFDTVHDAYVFLKK